MKHGFLALVIMTCAVVVNAQTPIFQITYHIGGASGSVPALPAASTMKNREVKVDNGLDPGDCTKGSGSYVVKCTSDGTIWKPSPAAIAAVDVRTFGAKCDDSTNDASAIQAAIDSLGTTSATRGGAEIVIPGPCAIGSTITIDRKSVIFRGLGWGRVGATGAQSYLRWIGAAGIPMLRVQNVQGVQIRDLHLIGNSSAKPSAAISLFQISGFGNNQNVLENIAIGDLVDGTSTGTGFVNGIACEGANANNDTWFARNIIIDGCSNYGIRQASIQNVNWTIDGLAITHSANGVYAVSGQLTGRSWSFGSVTGTDIFLPRNDDSGANTSPSVHVIGLVSEFSGRLAEIDGQGSLTIMSGKYQYGSFTASDGKYIIAENGGNGGDFYIELRDFAFQQISSPTVTPFISICSSAYANRHFASLILMDVTGLPPGGPQSNGISAQTKGTLEYKLIELHNVMGMSMSDYDPFPYTRNFLGGRFGGGEVFQLGRVDAPSRIRYAQDDHGQSIASAGAAITLGRRDILLKNTSGGPVTLTSTPTIPAGANGEEIQVMNVTSNAITLQDSATLGGTNLKLALPTITLAAYDSITLKYLANSGGSDYTGFNTWIQTGARIAALGAGAVTSVFGRSGAVVAATNDYTLAQINPVLGSDATGDLYYRNSSGVIARLPIGSADGKALVVSGGLPAWSSSVVVDPDQVFNAQTGTSYTIVSGDNTKFLTLNNASSIAVSLPQATGSFTTGWTIDIGTIGAGTATITPTTSTIDASRIGGSSSASSITIASGKSVRLVSNGTNYIAYNYQGRF